MHVSGDFVNREARLLLEKCVITRMRRSVDRCTGLQEISFDAYYDPNMPDTIPAPTRRELELVAELKESRERGEILWQRLDAALRTSFATEADNTLATEADTVAYSRWGWPGDGVVVAGGLLLVLFLGVMSAWL